MKHLLSTDAWSTVRRQLVAAPALVVMDFDGTLAPLVTDPSQARMSNETRRLIQDISRNFACAVVSSRPQQEIVRLLEGAAIWQIVGNHALEPDAPRSRYESEVRQWVPQLAASLKGVEGLDIENKGMSVALHYRRALDRVQARGTIWNAVRGIVGSRSIVGHDVVNVLPAGAPGKGVALARVIERWPTSSVLYIGDDESDEEAFGLDHPGLLSVRIGPTPGSRAGYFLESRREVDEVMRGLLGRPKPR